MLILNSIDSHLLAAFFSDRPLLWTVFFSMGAISTGLLVIQIGLMFIGISGDADVGDVGDLNVDGHFDVGDAGHVDAGMAFSVLSAQSIVAFFVGTGWAGLVFMEEVGLNNFLSVVLAVLVGGVLMVTVAYLGFMFRRLTSVAVVDLEECVGKTVNVYSRIPEHGQGTGQVEVVLSSGKKIMRARSVGAAADSFTSVKVISVDDDRETLAVEPVGGGAS